MPNIVGLAGLRLAIVEPKSILNSWRKPIDGWGCPGAVAVRPGARRRTHDGFEREKSLSRNSRRIYCVAFRAVGVNPGVGPE